MKNRIVIIDGNSLINRAYYAMQRPMITKDGLYTQGVYGFVNMLTKIRNDYESEYMAIAFDMKAPTFRHREYPDYKAGRRKMPPELAMQLPLLKEVLAAMNIKMVEIEGYEADDIIGTIAHVAETEGIEPLIITGDKDELQLASDKTTVIITKKGISEFEAYDRDAFVEKYGFTPTQFIDCKGLMGDQSDNIPGLPGVGEKTASKLIIEYGSVEEVLAHAEDLKGKLRETVEQNKEMATLSKWLATIDTNVPMEIDFDEYRLESPDHDALVEVYLKLEFNSFLKKLDAVPAAENSFEEAEIKTITIDDETGFDTIKGEIAGQGIFIKVIGNDDHRQQPSIEGIGILAGETHYYIKTCGDVDMTRAACKMLDEAAPKFAGHDLKSGYYMMKCYGLENIDTHFDTAICQYVLDSGRSNYDLNVLSEEYFRESMMPEKELLAGAGQTSMFPEDRSEEFCEYTKKWLQISQQMMLLQKKEIVDEGLEGVLYDIELPLIEVMADMEYRGFAVDSQALEMAGNEISGRVEELTNRIYALAGEEFNIKSTQQLGTILFEKLELTAGKKTKKGYSTNAETLEKIAGEHEIIPLILEYRMLTKLSGTYIDGMLPLIADDGRIHAHFNQTVTATGRISSSEPNLQNIPVRQELGRSLRKAFVPVEGATLVGADYSQIELRVLAHMSNDPALIESFNNGEDIHKATAARVLGVSEERITPDERSRAKAVNFGIIYGMSAFGLSSEIHITRKEAEEYIANYFAKHGAVKEFMDEQVDECKKKGYVKTMFGRKRRIAEISASNYMVRQLGERLAMNSPIQGSAADIIKLAMVKVYDELRPLKSRLILQVHDELIIETQANEEANVKELLKTSMEEACQMQVQLIVDLNVADDWYGLK